MPERPQKHFTCVIPKEKLTMMGCRPQEQATGMVSPAVTAAISDWI